MLKTKIDTIDFVIHLLFPMAKPHIMHSTTPSCLLLINHYITAFTLDFHLLLVSRKANTVTPPP